MDESHKSLRTQAASYMRQHPDDFTPFLFTSDSDGTLNLEAYITELESTPRWGGEMEIIALARRFKVGVEVVQATGGPLKFEEQNKHRIMLARYQHMYSLGAHFNSLRPK